MCSSMRQLNTENYDDLALFVCNVDMLNAETDVI